MKEKIDLSIKDDSIANQYKRISVIIPVKNMGDNITQCLEAIFNQTYPPFEVIVVDGHSTDFTVENAEKFETRILYEEYGTRAGANQVGIDNAKGDLIAFTDADCIPESNWLELLINEFRDGIVGVGGSVKNIGDSLWQKSINLSQNTFLGSANSIQGRTFKQNKFVISISGCNSIYKKNDLIKIGGFKTSLGTAEDTELNSRLLKYGKLLYVPEAVIVHNHGRGLADFSKRMKQYGFGRADSLLVDLQIIPPILAFLVFIAAFVRFELFEFAIALYIFITLAFTIKIFVKNPNPLYLFTIPVTYVIEHTYYTIGFWIGIVDKLQHKDE